MRPTVLSLAYPFAAVTADPVGGAEQVLAHLDRALVRAGSRSVVIGAEGSTPAGELVAVPAVPGEINDAARSRTHAAVRAAVSAVIARERVDLVHLHGIDFDAYLPPPGPPILVSLHLPISWYAPGALHPQRPNTHLLPVSLHQARTAPAELQLLPPIAQGVPQNYPRRTRRGYALRRPAGGRRARPNRLHRRRRGGHGGSHAPGR